MLKNMKIKTQVALIISLILITIITLQVIFYIILQNQNSKTINMIFDSVVEDIVSQIDTLNNDIAELSTLLSGHSLIQNSLYEFSHTEAVKNLTNIQELLSDYSARNKSIVSLSIIRQHDIFMYNQSVNCYTKIQQLIKQYTYFPEPQKMFTPSFIIDNKTYFAYVLPIYPTNVAYYTQEHTGNYIICIYEMNTISYAPFSFINNENIQLVITDNKKNVLLSDDPDALGKPQNFEYIENNYYAKTHSLNNPKWNITVLMPRSISSGITNTSKLFVMFMLVLNAILLSLMVRLLNGTIVKRILILKNNIKSFPFSSDFDCSVDYDFQDELSEVVLVINQMLKKINRLNQEKIETIDSLFKAELLQKETQIYYLYGQISPHFLYNSMSCIQGAALKYNATEVVQMTTSLSKIFRYFSNNLSLSTIKQDLDYAVEYFNIINMRRNMPIDIEYNISDDIQGIQCLKMIYQPVLENVLKHAFGAGEVGRVTINTIYDERLAIVSITDNGKGIPENILEKLEQEMTKMELSQIQDSEHVGLINVHMRLKLYYGEDCGLRIFSTPGHGTSVQIRLPKQDIHKDLA